MNMTGNAVDVEQLSSLLAAEVQAGRLTLPVMPEVATKVKAEAANPASSAKKLAQVIGTDAALAARILKMANSAIYAGLSEIKNLDHAIGRLGSAMVVALVIGAAGKETFRSKDPHFNTLLAGAWKRALCASASSRLIAKQLETEPEEAFLTGLLHAAGEPVLLETIRNLMASGTLEKPCDDAVTQVLKDLGPMAGSRLLNKWGLPEPMFKAIEYQCKPGDAPADFARGAWQVSLAGAFAYQQTDDSPGQKLAEHPAVSALGLDRERIDDLFRQAEEDVREIASVL